MQILVHVAYLLAGLHGIQTKTTNFQTKNLLLALSWQLNSALFKYKGTLCMSDQRVFPEEYTEFAKKHYFLSGLALVLRTQYTHAIVITKQLAL